MPVIPALSGRLLVTLLMTLLLSLTAVASRAEASGADVIADCVAGQLKASYPASDYADALGNIPTDLAEYSDCETQIKLARDSNLAATGGRGGTPYVAKSRATNLPAGSGAGAVAGATANGFEAADDADADSTDAAASTTPVPTTPQRGPDAESLDEESFLAMPVAGGGDGGSSAAGDDGLPLVPIVIAFSVIALTIARGMVVWSRRPETLPSGDAA